MVADDFDRRRARSRRSLRSRWGEAVKMRRVIRGLDDLYREGGGREDVNDYLEAWGVTKYDVRNWRRILGIPRGGGSAG